MKYKPKKWNTTLSGNYFGALTLEVWELIFVLLKGDLAYI